MEERMTDDRKPSEGELARLADGSLPAPRQAELRAQVQGSPELTAALAEQERAVTMLRALDRPAPAALRARIDEMTGVNVGPTQARRPARAWRRTLVLPAVTTFAVVVAAIVLLAGGGGAGAPSVPQTARLALAANTLPAPSADSSRPGQLRMQGAGIPFPNWNDVGWASSGARVDMVGGRRIATVFYTSADGARVGYSIVSGAPLRAIPGVTRNSYGRFTLARLGSARLVTWRQSGHTCVIASRSLGYSELLDLASDEEHQATGSQASAHQTAARPAYI
jgi:hypothetical protein